MSATRTEEAKRNKSLLIACVLLILTLLSMSMVSGTFAKYTSTATGSDTAKVAKWSFTVGSTEIANSTAQTVSFDLFGTINEADGTTAEGDVATGKIAPGTGGSFGFTITNSSEVSAYYAISLAATNSSSIPLQFSTDGTNWAADISTLSFSGSLASGASPSSSPTVYWRWCFEGTDTGAPSTQTDTSDTTLGIAAQGTAPEVTVTATVTATQVD